jgi:hypothetical protein
MLDFYLESNKNLGLYQGYEIRYQTYINSDQHTVITLEESHQNKIDSCHLYSVWKLKPKSNQYTFCSNHPFCIGVKPGYFHTRENFYNIDFNILQAPQVASPIFTQVWDSYLYYLDKVEFKTWEIQPNLTPILTRERRHCDQIIFKAEERLLMNIQKLGLNPADFGITI